MTKTPFAIASERIEDAGRGGSISLTLDLSDLGLTRLPQSLYGLSHLQSLFLQGNGLTYLPASIGKLSALRTLNVSSNKLTRLPDALGQLLQLQTLNLRDNQLSSVTESIGRLNQLQHLVLADNRLTDLPESLRRPRSLRSLYLHGNQGLGLPPELLGPTWQEVLYDKARPSPPAAILDYYFRARASQRRPLNEAKLILVGRGGVGKTSVVNRLVHKTFKDEKKTEGIRITEWPLVVGRKKDEVRLNVWDFGGQEIMHATHQFFLTERSLYLLVLSGREGNADDAAEYWLKLIQSFGNDSPVVVVLNKIKEHPFDVNRSALQQKYPFIREFIRTDCKAGTGITELRRAVERETDRLEHLRDAFPTAWFSIKDKLAGMRRNYLSYDDYRRLCAESGETDPAAQETLAFYLHSLGIILHFRDDPRLSATYIFNPQWVLNGIYKILNAHRLEKQRGEISLGDLLEILDKRKYPEEMHGFLLELMKKFELCFDIPGKESEYLIPELLDKQEPMEAREFRPEECLNFEYLYPVLPGGLLPRFVVRTHVLSDESPRWRTGVILKLEENLALVKGDLQDKRVFINVKGPVAGRRRLLSIIRANFDRIHADIRRLQPAEIVPLPGRPGASVPYAELLASQQSGIKHFTKTVDGSAVEIDVDALLDGIKLEAELDAEPTVGERVRAARIFVSYSHKEEWLLNELRAHLSPLRRMKLIETWDDREIEAGEDWREKINENLERADLFILLVSAAFIASDYCFEKEFGRALELHKQKELRIIPVIVREANWEKIKQLSGLQAVPKNGKAVTSWANKDKAWRDVSESIQKLIEAMPARRESRVRPEDGKARAEAAENRARALLAELDYHGALEQVTAAMAADPERSDRLRDEFGFILSIDKDATHSEELAGLRWCARVWRILSEHNHFDPPLLSVQSSEPDTPAAPQGADVLRPKVREQTGSSSEQRGEALEQAVIRLLQEFFQLGEGKDEVLKSLRQQRRGTQFGYDIGFDFDCVLEWNHTIRCHIECKNLTKEVTLKDISDKLNSQNHFDRHIHLWILISPRADISNELAEVLEGWKRNPLYPFDVQVWCPSTGVAEFFGLVPEVYEAFFEKGGAGIGPRDWGEGRRAEVRERWKQKLKPPLRLPEGWERYLREPFLLCLRREDNKALDATYSNHVTMMCRHGGGALMPLPLEHYVREWMAQPDKPVFFLLGEFGDGKSFFTYTLARHLASEFRESPETGWIPLRLALRDFFETGQVRDFLRRRLDEFGATLEGWTTLRATRRILIILDGFDEMSKQLDPATVTRNINALIQCYEEFEGCKVMITSRTHFFEWRQEERLLMSRLNEPLVFRLAPIPRRETVRHLEATAGRMGLQQSMARLYKLHDPIGLAAKPLFLQMLKDTLNDLPDDLDEVTLYERYVRNSLRRKADQLDDTELKTDREDLLDKLTSLLEEIAVELQVSEREYVSLSKFSHERQEGFAELLWKMTGPEYEADAAARVGVRSLLSRVEISNMEDEWPVDFCHRSIREYFVARSLCSVVKGEGGEQFLKNVLLNHEIFDFAAARMRKTPAEQWGNALLRLTGLATPDKEPGRLGGGALTLLYRLDPSLPDSDWTGRVFDYVDLEGADLSGKVFRGSSFRYANLTNVNFQNADFEECDLTGVRIEETTEVVSLCAFPSGGQLLATYSDGTARVWNLKHPRKSESRIVASQLPRDQSTVGILEGGVAWSRSPTALTIMSLDQDGELRLEAQYPIKTAYRLASPREADLIVVEDKANGQERVLILDLEQQGIVSTVAARSVTLCVALGHGAVVLNDVAGGLRVVETEAREGSAAKMVEGGMVTCLSSMEIQESVHMIAWGEKDGTTQVCTVDLRGEQCVVRRVLTHCLHQEAVTAVTFLDDARIASGGQDRSIIISRIDAQGDSPLDVMERRLQLTLQCKGMRITGLKGPAEQQKLSELIAKSEREVAGTG